jgi:hypothetical protein
MSLIPNTRSSIRVPEHILIQRLDTGIHSAYCLRCGDGVDYAGTLKDWRPDQLRAHVRTWDAQHNCKVTPM